jgi:hypothetical protein
MNRLVFITPEYMKYRIAEADTARGNVTIQVVTMSLTTFQSTAVLPRVAPTPTIDPLMMWVEEVGIPVIVRAEMTRPPAEDAQNP